MANTKYLVTIEMKVPNSVSLMLGKESVKTVLNLHNAIARGRTGAGEILFNDKCKDLWGDAISHVKEAILSPEHALLVMELGQPCTNWTDADRRLAEQALDKLHARHILHGDLHSGNVVFVGEGDKRKARIIDLESARVYRGQDFDELAAKEKARVVRFGTATERARRYDK
ncbi:hypothetical protein BC831DRAFT_502960 [Entophlyctis helioformis]|nr:hypothetical protein BC831DRAFT_502960 [Entophlyctis helioformis]